MQPTNKNVWNDDGKMWRRNNRESTVRRRSAMADNWQPSTKLPQDWWISVFTALSSQDADYLDADDVSSVHR